MKIEKRHGKVSRREFVSTAGSCAAAAVGLGSALTACGGDTPNELEPPQDTLPPQPPDPDTAVVFSSQWLTATGTSDAARRDTNNPSANGGPFLMSSESAHSVVTGSTYNWPYGNCLMIEQGMGRGVPGSVFIGDGNLNSAVPANTDYYFRMYINVWDVIVNDYVGHPCNSSLFSPLLGFWGIVEARTSPSLQYRPRLIRAYTLNGGSEGPDLPPRGLSDVSQRVGGFWWPGYYPVGASRSCNCNVWLDQQHWYLFEWWVHYLDVAQQRYFFGSLDIYDAENNYAHVADLSDYHHEVQPGIVRTLEQARLDGAFVYKGYLTSADPLNIDVYPWVGGVNPWQIMIGCEGNAAQQLVSPYERYLYAAPAVATGGFPARLPAL